MINLKSHTASRLPHGSRVNPSVSITPLPAMSPSPEDLPQMWQRPPPEVVLAALRGLQVTPPVWNYKRRRSEILQDQEAAAHAHREVSAYLSSVIKSGLVWVDDDDAREEIWSEASRRMSERCGRAAMGEITRRWPFEIEGTPSFELAIREPPITGGSLGLKTWGSSYLLAHHLPRLAATTLFGIFDESLGQVRPRVLELGSGTGLLGLAAAALWRAPVYLSDLPDIVPNLSVNAEANRSAIESFGGSLAIGALTWGGSEDEIDQELFGEKNQFKVKHGPTPYTCFTMLTKPPGRSRCGSPV